ncbi:hypothetical protein SK128_026038 [Halocaridina rubra]|uniref:Uncharacterized protein n=1 Tax=Halocaridina rubra TaxID=373956 RepID=A0AAN8X133_HALRR
MSFILGVKSTEPSSSSSSLSSSGKVITSNLVTGDRTEGCVVFNLQNNLAVKESSELPSQPLPYLLQGHYLGPVCFLPENDPLSVNNRDTTTENANSKEVSDDFSLSCKASLLKSNNGSALSDSQKENLQLKVEMEDVSPNSPKRKSAKKARLMMKTLNEERAVCAMDSVKKEMYSLSCGKTVKRPKSSSSVVSDMAIGNISEMPMEDMPIWARNLSSVRVLDGQLLVGIAPSKDILQGTLECHTRSILCDYIKSHPNNIDKRRNAREQECRVMWQYKWIVFDGVPFSTASSDDLRCTFGMKYKIKRKETSKTQDSAIKEEGNITPKKMYKEVSRTSCPAKIIVKVIIKYPGYKVSPYALLPERRSMLQALRSDLSRKLDMEKEEFYYVTLPLESMHNHPFTGRSRNIHSSIIAKVRSLVQNGITAPKIIKKHLDAYVHLQHGQDVVVPHPEDRAYYPKLKDIGNLVYNNCRRLGIPSKQKASMGQSLDSTSRKKRLKSSLSGGDNIDDCGDIGSAETLSLRASTLQEAVQTFCTDEADRGIISVSDQECVPASAISENQSSSEAVSLAESVRLQLESLRNLTYSLHDISSLRDIHQSLQVLLNQFSSVSHQNVQGTLESSGTAAAYIIQEPVLDHLSTESSSLQSVTSAAADSHSGTERESYGVILASRVRNTQNPSENHHVRQIRPPIALQCVATNVVPTIAMSQIPRSSTQTSAAQGPPHLVSSIPSYSAVNATNVTLAQPSYQMLTSAQQLSAAVPVQLSLPPYFYYVQEVAVPDSSVPNTASNAYSH